MTAKHGRNARATPAPPKLPSASANPPAPTGRPALADAIAAHPHGATLALVVVPRSGVTGFDRMDGDALRIRVAAPPVEGAANSALLLFLAEAVGLPRSRLRIVGGKTARRKRILFAGLTPDDLARRLGSGLPRG